MNSSPAEPPADYFGFPDLNALQAAHARLIKQQADEPVPADFLDSVDAFIIRAQATGRLLGEDEARNAAQTIIDYWVTVLMRGRRTPPETGLAEYGFHASSASIRETSAGEYLNEERVAIRKRLRLSAAAAQWNDSERDRQLLWGGDELTDAASYDDLTALEREFIAAGGADVRREKRVRRSVITFAVVAGCLILGLIYGSLLLRAEAAKRLADVEATARRASQHQLASNILANASNLMRAGDVGGSFLLLNRALREDLKAGEPDKTHLLRIGAAMAQLPRLRLALLEDDELHGCQGARFSPQDGRTILTFSNTWTELGGSVRLWNAADGKRLADFEIGKLPVIEAGYCHDGRILTVTADYHKGRGAARVWEPDGRPVRDLGDLPGDVRLATLSPTGDRVALVYRRGKDLDTFIEVRQIADGVSLTAPIPWVGEVRQVSFSPDGSYVVACGAAPERESEGQKRLAGQVGVWNAWTGADSSIGLMLHERPVNCAAFAADNLRLVTGSGEVNEDPGTVEVWSVFVGQPVVGGQREQYHARHLFSREHDGRVNSVSFSPDGRSVLSASFDETVRLWDLEKQDAPPQTFRHANAVLHAGFSPDGRHIIAGGRDQTARVWKVGNGKLALPLLNHGDVVSSVAFSPDGESLLTVTREGARVWQRGTGEPAAPLLQLGDPVWQTALSGDGQRVVALSQSGVIGTWDAQTGKPEAANEERAALANAESIFFSDDVRNAVVSFAPSAQLIETKADGAVLTKIKFPPAVTYAAFSPDHTRVLLAYGERGGTDDGRRLGRTEIRGVDSKAKVLAVLATRGIVSYAVFSADGRHVLTASGALSEPAGEARVWDASDGTPITLPLAYAHEVTHACFNGDLSRVAIASLDGSATVWDIDLALRTARAGPRVAGHSAGLTRVIFSPDGRVLLTASSDRTAQLWLLSAPAQPLAVLPHEGRINDAGFSPDGGLVVTACSDGRARVWDVETGAWVAHFPHEGEVTRAYISKADAGGGLKVVTLSANSVGKSARAAGQSDGLVKVQTWRLSAAAESLDDLDHLAKVMRAQKLDEAGAIARLSRLEFAAEYQASVRGGLLERFNRESPPTAPLDRVTECERSNQWFAARWHLSRLLAADPANADLLERRGIAASQIPDWPAARADFQQAVAGPQPSPRIFLRQVRADLAVGQWDDAILHATDGLARGGDPRSLTMLRAEAQAARERWSEAAADLEETIRLKPHLPSSYERLGVIRLKQNQPEEHRKLCAEMIARFAQDEGLHGIVAWACVLRDGAIADPQTAVAMAQSAVEDRPGSSYPRNTLGAAYYRAGQFVQAVDQLNESCATYTQAARIARARGYSTAPSLHPEDDGRPVDWVFLAMAHHRLARHAKAQEFLGKTRSALNRPPVRESRRTWNRLELELLFAEAEALLQSAPANPGPPVPARRGQ